MYACSGYVRYSANGSFSVVVNPGSASTSVGRRFTIVAHVYSTVAGSSMMQRVSGSPKMTQS